jgi:nitrogen-specific signal transduction histidine kinase
MNQGCMDRGDTKKNNLAFPSEGEYRKLAYMFPDYLFLDKDYVIRLAGRGVEEMLDYNHGSLRDQGISFLSDADDLKSSIMIQISENFFEWRSYTVRSKRGDSVQVELCGLKIGTPAISISPIVIRMRWSRNHLESTTHPEVDKLTYWIAHNLRGPVATIKGLINLAKDPCDAIELSSYLNYMARETQRLDEKIRLMVRLAGKIRN